MRRDKIKSPVEIDWKVVSGKIVFFEAPEGPELGSMDGERWGLLMTANYVQERLRGVPLAEERLFPAIWGIEKLVEAQRLVKAGLGLGEVAKVWDTTDASVRAFYSQASQKFLHAQDLVKQEEARQAKGDGVCVELETPWPADYKLGQREPTTHIMLSISRVAEMLKANGNNYREVWQTFGVKSDAFNRWMDANQKAPAILGVVL